MKHIELKAEKLTPLHANMLVNAVNEILSICIKGKSYTANSLKTHFEETESDGQVFFYEDKVVAFYSSYADIDDNDSTFIDYIWVDEKFRNMHIGLAVMQAALQCSINNNRKTIFLETAETNINAIKFYEKIGFKEVIREDDYILFGINVL